MDDEAAALTQLSGEPAIVKLGTACDDGIVPSEKEEEGKIKKEEKKDENLSGCQD